MEINVEDIVKKTVLEKGYIPNEIEALISLATMGATIVAYKEKRTDVGQVQDSIAEALIRLHMMTYNYGHDRIAEIVA